MPNGFHALGGSCLGAVEREPVGVERLRVRPPHRRVAVQLRRQHQQGLARLHPVAAADHGVLVRLHRERGRGRPQPQRLLEDLVEVVQPGQVGERRRAVAQHLLDVGAGPLQHLRVAQQLVDRERQQPTGGLVSRDQERDQLVAHVLVRQPVAGLRVGRGEHRVEDVVLAIGQRVAAAVGDQLVDDLVHEPLVLVVLMVFAHHQPVLDRQPTPALTGLHQRPDHRADERVHLRRSTCC